MKSGAMTTSPSPERLIITSPGCAIRSRRIPPSRSSSSRRIGSVINSSADPAAALNRNRRAPPTIRARFRECGEISRLHLLDLEAPLRDERRDVPCQAQAFKYPVMNRLPPLLPAPYLRVGGYPEFKE